MLIGPPRPCRRVIFLMLKLMLVLLATRPLGAETLTTLPDPVARAARTLGVAQDSMSVWVQAVGEREPRLAFNQHVPRNPASTLKLVTTFAALERLGPAYTWRTEVHLGAPLRRGRVEGDLWLRGEGDPYFVTEEYWRLLSELRNRGVERIDGDLVFDTSYFDLPAESAGAFDGEPDRVYNLIPHPLLVNFNAVQLRLRPGRDGVSVQVDADPALPNLQLRNALKLHRGPCAGYQRGVALSVQGLPERDEVQLEGRFPTGCSEYHMTRTVLQPESYAYGLFDLYWRQLGGTLGGGWRGEPLPESAGLPFYVHRSRPLGDLLRLINKYSNNVMTRHLALTLGAERFGAPATPEKGRRAMLEILEANGIDTRGLVIDNAAGLSRNARITANQLGAVLQAAWRSPYMPEFVSSLSLSGLDGTVRRRFRGGREQGRMHLKTGTLDDVSGIAGFVQSETGERFMVVVLTNGADMHRGPGEELQDMLLRWVHRL